MMIDIHTHFYNPFRPHGVPWPSENDGPIYRTALPDHHCELAEPASVAGTVVTVASVGYKDNQWALDLVKDSWIVGVVGHVASDTDFGHRISKLASNSLCCGIRAGEDFVDDRAISRAETISG